MSFTSDIVAPIVTRPWHSDAIVTRCCLTPRKWTVAVVSQIPAYSLLTNPSYRLTSVEITGGKRAGFPRNSPQKLIG